MVFEKIFYLKTQEEGTYHLCGNRALHAILNKTTEKVRQRFGSGFVVLPL
jgi:hypothetical protein